MEDWLRQKGDGRGGGGRRTGWGRSAMGQAMEIGRRRRAMGEEVSDGGLGEGRARLPWQAVEIGRGRRVLGDWVKESWGSGRWRIG